MVNRDHAPAVLDTFNGLYQRGSPDSGPPDHFTDCENLRFIGTTEFGTRYGISPHQNVLAPLGNIKRIYNYITQDENTLLVMIDNSGTGEIYHVVDGTNVFGPILSIAGMEDFGFAAYAGRAYITPVKTYGTSPNLQQKGMQSEFLYVYFGDGTAARQAGGDPPTAGTLTIANGTGNTDAGFHLFGVLYETDSGFLTEPARLTGFTTSAANGISFSAIPISPDPAVVARRLIATRTITNYNGDTQGYTYYFIPTGRIDNNIDTTLNNITMFDLDLVEDASYLFDIFNDIPAGAGLTIYHDRLCLYTTYDDISIVRISAEGDPEVFNEIDGFVIAPLDGNPITNAQEMRDVLYVFKRNRTVSFIDNGDVPTSWPLVIIDYGLGCPLHGVATVIDAGASSVDYLIVASYRGIMIFNGTYQDMELSWKIRDLWISQDQDEFRRIQILDDTVDKILYCCLPDYRLLVGDYGNGKDPQKIRWVPVRFDVRCNTIALINVNQVIIGSDLLMS